MIETRDRIINGADELFMRYGIKSITMDDIASHLAISKKTIYQNFKDKDELVLEVMRLKLEEEKREIQEIVDTSSNAIEEIFRVSLYIKTMLSNMNPSVIFDTQKYHVKAWSHFDEHKGECFEATIFNNIKNGIEEGLYRENMSAEIMSRLRLWEIEFGFDQGVFPISEFNPLDVQMQIFDHFIYGIITEKGKELLDQYKQENEN